VTFFFLNSCICDPQALYFHQLTQYGQIMLEKTAPWDQVVC